ncbi:MAG: TIGR01777 family protein [Ignavibacteriaceae bacterium]|nr:TIGR01777 family protein [Ignavibacteriaceae bacterium]
MKKIVITGGTGLIGGILFKMFSERGDQVYLFSRNPDDAKRKIPGAAGYLKWRGNNFDYSAELEGTDAVIHLAGANVAGQKWNAAYKKEIFDSRIGSTRALVEAMKKLKNKPEVFVCSSAVGYYGDASEKELTEDTKPADTFLADVCLQWEKAAEKSEAAGVRSVQIRTGVVLSPKDGALKKLLLPFKLFVGGPLGSGCQWFPWIHADDIAAMYIYAIDKTSMRGAFNGAAPQPLRMSEFAAALGKVLKRPSLFPVPKFVLRLILGEGAAVTLASQKVIPKAIIKEGFKFKFPEIDAALRNLLE